MELAEQKNAVFHSIVELLLNQWKEVERHLKGENQDSVDSKMIELNDKRNEVLMKVRDLELKERIRQKEFEQEKKILEQKSLDLETQKRALVKREILLDSKMEGIKRREAELHLGKKKLEDVEEGFEFKVKMEERKRKMADSGCARNVQTTVQGRDGLSFLLKIVKTHERAYMTVPGPFVSAYDLSGKKYVILSTDKGDFRLEVMYYSPRIIVHFRKGWKDFYTKNLLKIGSQCLFRLKEDTVNGDASGFSMDVSVLDH